MEKNLNEIRVLIVDDHKLFLDGIKSILSDESNILVVGKALNGVQAIEFIENHQPDVVLMDVKMPFMNGIEATKIISEKYPQTKVIALTTYDEQAIIEKMLEVGAKGYVLKNFSKENLRDAIMRVMKGELVFDSDILIAQATKSFNSEENLNSTDFAGSSRDISLFNTLTDREIQVLNSIVNGKSNKQISEDLSISLKTVGTHRNNILKKTKTHNTATLVKLAVQSGFVK